MTRPYSLRRAGPFTTDQEGGTIYHQPIQDDAFFFDNSSLTWLSVRPVGRQLRRWSAIQYVSILVSSNERR